MSGQVRSAQQSAVYPILVPTHNPRTGRGQSDHDDDQLVAGRRPNHFEGRRVFAFGEPVRHGVGQRRLMLLLHLHHRCGRQRSHRPSRLSPRNRRGCGRRGHGELDVLAAIAIAAAATVGDDCHFRIYFCRVDSSSCSSARKFSSSNTVCSVRVLVGSLYCIDT